MASNITHLQRVRRLYKTILRLHRGLPPEIKELGDKYVKDEFRRHKTVKAAESNVFMNEWAVYAVSLAEQLGIRGPKTSQPLGKSLDQEYLQMFNDQQIYQLYELMQAATNRPKSGPNNSGI